ncbi:MAG: HAMP domain-containing sensor histidine kinase [Candidatus Brocadiia bacterium]|jgi:signal transduction histidine kinase
MRKEATYAAATKKAARLIVKEKKTEARAVLQDALGRAVAAKQEGYALFFQGELAFLDGEPLKGFELEKRARELKPRSLTILRTLGLKSLALGRLAEAIERFDEILAIRPRDAWARLCRSSAQLSITIAGLKTHFDEISAAREKEEQRIKLDAWRSLSARAAHRIGNQLFASMGALRTLSKLDVPEAREAVEDLSGNVDRIRRIVQEFQRFSANEAPRLLPADIAVLVSDVVRRHTDLKPNIALSSQVQGPFICEIDRIQFEQALGELLENAMFHTKPGGEITVRVEPVEAPNAQNVRIIIQDTGAGIPPQSKERIFQAFYSTKPGGSGLGLAIVRQIVENHKGTIRETGQEGAGARFEIVLPVKAREESRQ